MPRLPSDETEFLCVPAAKRAYNEVLFAEVARRYDLVTRALSLGRDQAWKRALLASLPGADAAPRGGASVCVDLACGTGDVALQEIHRVLRPGGTAAFLDFSKSPHWLWQRLTYGVLYVWGAFWGLLLHRQPAVYAYIAKSLWHFPDRISLRRELAQTGFTELSSRQFYFGTLELITVAKAIAE